VTLDNLSDAAQRGLSVEAKVYTTAGKPLDDRTASGIDVPAQQVRNAVLTPKVPATTTEPAPASTYVGQARRRVLPAGGHPARQRPRR
jgi:exo-1,4-beta-D-glucosaminidase